MDFQSGDAIKGPYSPRVYAVLGELITLLADKVTYLRVGRTKNVFGDMWEIRAVKIVNNKTYNISQLFTSQQLEAIQDVRVVAAAFFDMLKEELPQHRK